MDVAHIVSQHYRNMKLTIKDGAIYDLHGDHASNKQMDTPEIRVSEKLGFAELGSSIVSYSFRLSYHTDQVWRAILESAYPEAPIKIAGDNLQLMCSPNDLSIIYDRVKKAFEQTNVAYKESIPQVRMLAERQDAVRQDQKKKAEEHQKSLTKSLDDLEL